MRISRANLRGAGGLIFAILALGVAPGGARAATFSTSSAAVIAMSGGRAVVAWTDGGFVRTADQLASGDWTRGTPLGRAIDGVSPRLEASPVGDVMVVWQSGRALRSAFRKAGSRSWTRETIVGAGQAGEASIGLVLDQTGRATVTDLDFTAGTGFGSLGVMSRVPGHTWGAPTFIAGGVGTSAIALDASGNMALAFTTADYVSRTIIVWATTLPLGAASWAKPMAIAGSESIDHRVVRIAGGSEGKFLVTWASAVSTGSDANTPIVAHAARSDVLGHWESLPNLLAPAGVGVASPSYPDIAVDRSGNAVAAWPFPTANHDQALAAARLPAAGNDWTSSTVLDAPSSRDESDSPPAVAFDDDGSADIAFVKRSTSGFFLRFATAQGPLGVWQGQGASIAKVSDCALSCAAETDLPPAIALGEKHGIAIATRTKAGLVVIARDGPDQPWAGPTALQAVGTTAAYLRSARVRRGFVAPVASCALAPCVAVAVLRTRGDKPQILGRLRLAIPTLARVSGRMSLSQWARARLTHGARLHTELSVGLQNSDGTTERLRLNVLVHS